MKINCSDKKFIKAVANNISAAATLKELGLVPNGANYKTIKIKLRELNLNTDHWLGKAHLRGKSHSWSKKRPLDEILIKNSNYRSSAYLKKRLVKAAILEDKCFKCGLTEWQNEPISLHLEHINGDNCDNRIENLCILCPNCHSQTPTFAGRNIGKNFGKKAKKKQCLDCNKSISSGGSRCRSCAAFLKMRNKTKISWPDTKILIQMVKETSYTKVARELGVSDNAVRKRIKNHSSNI